MAESSKYEEKTLLEYQLSEASKRTELQPDPTTEGKFNDAEDQVDAKNELKRIFKRGRMVDPHYAQQAPSGKGNAVINFNDRSELYTDIDLKLIPLGALPKSLNIPGVISVEAINVTVGNKMLPYTRVTITDQNQHSRQFSVATVPGNIEARINKTVPHIMLVAHGNFWNSRGDLELKHRARHTPKDTAVFMAMSRDVNTSMTKQHSDALEEMTAALPLVAARVSGMPNSFIFDASTTDTDTNNIVSALNGEWNEHRPTNRILNSNGLSRMRQALLRLRNGKNGYGCVIGTYTDTNGAPHYGFKLFNGTELTTGVAAYIQELAEVEADYMSGDTKMIDKIVREETAVLRAAYRASNNADNNGVVDFDMLVVHDFIKDKNDLEQHVFVAPGLLALAKSHMDAKKYAVDTRQSGRALEVLRMTIEANQRSVQTRLAFAKDIAFNRITGATKDGNDVMERRRKEWLPMLAAYDPDNMTKVNTYDLTKTKLRGWARLTRVTRSGFKKVEEFVFVPPTVTGTDRENVFLKYKARGFAPPEDGTGYLNVEDVILNLYDNHGNMIPAYVDMGKDRVAVPLKTILDKSLEYGRLTPESENVRIMQNLYGFAEYRAAYQGKTATDTVKEDLMRYIEEMGRGGAASKEYKAATEKMTTAFKDIYSTLNNNTEIASTLTAMGPMYLPEEGLTVMFGPSGSLYKVIDYGKDGKRPTIEEMPVRAFAGGSMYMKVLKRLMDLAQSGNTGNSKLRFTANNAFNFRPGDTHSRVFTNWASKVLDNMQDVRAYEWSQQLKGIAMYGRLTSLLNNRFAKDTPLTHIRDKEVVSGYTVSDPTDDTRAMDRIATDAYSDVVKYLKLVYGEKAISEDQFLNGYNMDPAVAAAVKHQYNEERNRLAANLNNYADAWKACEHAFDRTIAVTPGSKKALMTIYDLERARMKPSIVGAAIDGFTRFIEKIYYQFVSSIQSVFDIFNPITVINSLQKATITAISQTIGVLFSNLFTNFLDIHFQGHTTGKRWAKDVFENFEVKILNTQERKLMGRIQGSTQLAHFSKFGMHKDAAINAAFDNLRSGIDKEPAHVKDAFNAAIHGPVLAIPHGSKTDDMKDEEFLVAYHVHSPSSFNKEVDELGNVDFEAIRDSKEALNRWWRSKGCDLLFPRWLERTSGAPGEAGKNIMTEKLFNQVRNVPNPSEFVKVRGNDISITLKLRTMFGIEPKDVWGDRSDVRQAERMFRTNETKERMLADREFAARKPVDEYEGVPRMKRNAPNPLRGKGGGVNLFGDVRDADLAPEDGIPTSQQPHDEAHGWRPRELPSDRMRRKEQEG